MSHIFPDPPPTPEGIGPKLNYIWRFIENPCHGRWYLYLETAYVPFGFLLLAFTEFAWDDIVRSYFRPKSARTGRHTRRGGRNGRRGAGIPDPGEIIGKNLPGAEDARGRNVSQGVRHFWAIDEVLQRFLWYWFLAEVITDFGVRWVSNINESFVCKTQGQGAFGGYGSGQIVLAISDWVAVEATDDIWQEPPATWDGFEGSVGAGRYNVLVAATVRNEHPSAPATFEARCVMTGAKPGPFGYTSINIAPQATGQIVMVAIVTGAGLVFPQFRADRNCSIVSCDVWSQRLGSGAPV